MSLGDLFEQIREFYVERFQTAIEEYGAEKGVTVLPEAALSDDDGKVVAEGDLELPFRGDIFVMRDGEIEQSIQIDTEEMVGFDLVSFEWPDNNLAIEMLPFQWNWAQLKLEGLPENVDWEPLRHWFMNWFQDEDPQGVELLEAVHFMSDPEEREDHQLISLDLGTAPVIAIEELFDVVGTLGATRLHIGQFEDGDEEE